VIRDGKESEVEFEELVIGDIIKMIYGTQVPVDCFLVKFDGNCVKCDESSVTGESDVIVKCTLKNVQEEKSGEEGCDPVNRYCLMISGSTVTEGTAYGLIMSVGENTYIRKQTLLDAVQESPLQEKLAVIADQIAYIGFAAAFLTIAVIWTKVGVQGRGSDESQNE